MKLLVNGASFSYGIGSWPELLPADTTNLSQWNAGNTYIQASTNEELHKNSYDMVIVMWSPFDRTDTRISATEWKFETDTETDQWIRYESSLRRIIMLQEFLKYRNQPYLFTFARTLKQFDKFTELYNQLDQTQVFPLTLQSVIKENNWYATDGVHPNLEAHQYYAKQLTEYLEGRLK